MKKINPQGKQKRFSKASVKGLSIATIKYLKKDPYLAPFSNQPVLQIATGYNPSFIETLKKSIPASIHKGIRARNSCFYSR